MLFVASILVASAPAFAQEDDNVADTISSDVASPVAVKPFNLHFQTTYIYQYKPEFSAKYSGINSLKTAEEKQNSLTATLYLGVRLWNGAELYVNPEVAGGSGLSGAFGMAASTNGETFRVGNPEPTLYLGRGYIKQTIVIGTKKEQLEDGANQLQTQEPESYVRFYLGKMCLGDLFDNNAYSNSPRTQFMNWCLMNNGAWDYAANVRGYTYTFATALKIEDMTYKVALATLPKVANGPDLNTNLGEAFSINAEVSKQWKIDGRSGGVRLLGYHNYGNMGNYAEALRNIDTSGVPNVVATRKSGRTKTGVGLNADQQLTKVTGVFFRAGWNDGLNETWAFTEADRTISAGIAINGAAWERKDDNLALAIVANGLSDDHRRYLAAGGNGFQLGDGKLSYANETVAELYYNYKPVASGIWLTADYQFVVNPGYNKDRGPANVFSLRLHVEL